MRILLIFFSFPILMACGNSEKNVEITTLKPGDNAPAFNLKNINGEMVSPENYPDAKGFIVIFRTNTCPVAKQYKGRVIALDKKFSPKGYPVIAINANVPGLLGGDGYEKMQKRAKNKGFTFPYLFDDGQKATDQYGARVTPHVFLLKKEGLGIKVMYTGAVDNDTPGENPNKTVFVENAIASLEAGKKSRWSPPKPSVALSKDRRFLSELSQQKLAYSGIDSN